MMNTRQFSTIAVLMLAIFCPATNAEDCYVIPKAEVGRTPIRVCKVLFPLLVSGKSVERYVELTGYVALLDERPYLFASKDIYFYSGGSGGVALDLAEPERDRFNRMVLKEGVVTVAGRYHPGSKWGGADSIGTLEVIGRHYWIQERPGAPPELPEG